MKAYLFLLAVILLLSGVELEAQEVYGRVETGMGGLIRHSKKFEFRSPEWTQSFDISAQWMTDSGQSWAKYHNYPSYGMHLRYHSFGNRSVLGHSLGFYPSVHIPAHRNLWGGGLLEFMIGSGVSYVTRPFDGVRNPTNTANGTHWNALARLKIQYSREIRGWRWGLYSDFTHVSNGRMSTPNTGLNTAEVGLSIWPDQPQPEEEMGISKRSLARKWSAEGVLGLAWTSHSTFPSPRFPVYIAKLAIIRSVGAVQRLHLGLEWERNMERAHFQRGMLGLVSRDEALRYATVYLLYLGDEFIFGPVSLGVTAGIYIQSDRNTFPIYNQLFARYYFFPNESTKGLFLGVYLKSHLATAQYLGFGLGYQI